MCVTVETCVQNFVGTSSIPRTEIVCDLMERLNRHLAVFQKERRNNDNDVPKQTTLEQLTIDVDDCCMESLFVLT